MAGRIAYYGNIVKDGLVLCLDAAKKDSYPGSGTTWRDVSGFQNHVQLYNSITYSDRSLSGDGTNAYGRTINTLNLSNVAGITVMSAVKTPTTSSIGMLYEHTANWNIINVYSGTSYGGFGFYSNSNGSFNVPNLNHFQLRGNSNYAGVNASTPDSTKYQHYAIVHNFAAPTPESTAYVNGAFTANSSNNSSGGPFNTDNTGTFADDYFYLWSRGGVSAFSAGTISLLMLYNRALSASEILQNYNATKGRYGL